MGRVVRWLLGTSRDGHLWPRWIFLRLLGLWFLSAFYSLWFQVRGLIGSRGILPIGSYLEVVHRDVEGLARFWDTPSLFWFGSSDQVLIGLCGAGIVASLLLITNVWPRVAVAACTVVFLSFITTLQRFASYQSDGMLLEAGLICVFFAPPGLRPGLGAASPPSRISLFALQWLWFRIYFESGVAKIHGHDPEWMHLTAMDRYYENGPLPTWLAWYAQQRLPHLFHEATAFMTLAAELVLVWALFLPRAARIALFLVLTPFQTGIILTANYAFLNYLVLSLGVLLIDDRFLARLGLRTPTVEPRIATLGRWLEGVIVSWQLYATTVLLLLTLGVDVLPEQPAQWLAPSRFANDYHLFGTMTRERNEIEFEGTTDGVHWMPYRFRYKPQDPNEAPGLYAPYQPRFEWNLWFASLGGWHENGWVLRCAQRLLQQSPEVLALFREDPFAGKQPIQVRAMEAQYWFTTPEEKTATGAWWRRGPSRSYGPALRRESDGEIVAADGD